MAQVTAKLFNYRQAPRKVRIVANLVRGKSVPVAVNELAFLAKRASDPIKKLLMSGVANAKNLSIDADNLFVKEIRVDQGTIMKRSMPRARGRAFPIHKHTSHIILTLDTENPIEVKKAARKAAKATK